MYGMGVTVGDYDNDGWPDVFITGVGGNRLFHNEPAPGGGRRFRDVTAEAGRRRSRAAGRRRATEISYIGRSRCRFSLRPPSSITTATAGSICSFAAMSPGRPTYDLHADFSVAGGGDRGFGPPTAFEGRPVLPLPQPGRRQVRRRFRTRPAFKCSTTEGVDPTGRLRPSPSRSV